MSKEDREEMKAELMVMFNEQKEYVNGVRKIIREDHVLSMNTYSDMLAIIHQYAELDALDVQSGEKSVIETANTTHCLKTSANNR